MAEYTAEAEAIIEDKAQVSKGCFNGWCPNLKLRYSLSRKAVKKTQDLVLLQGEGKEYTQSSDSPPPPCEDPIPTTQFQGFESRTLVMNEIIEALKDDGINLIGICGMGGIGKTTMAKEVAKRAKEENLFNEVAMAAVSQEPNLIKVQGCIADMLGLKLDDRENPIARASLLRKRLVLDNRKILVILDDIWEEFNLEELGFPLGGDANKGGCKILFTSRSRNMWRGIQNKRFIELEVLLNKEAWHLFKEKAGNCVDTPDLLPLAKEIVDECGGLPLALVTMGSALVNERTQHHWKLALRQLRTPSSESISSGVPAKVYQALDFNYNFLKDERAKKLFLLCCLFEEDYSIPIEILVRFVIGLQWFEGIDKVDEVRDGVYVLVDQLQSCYLLLDGDVEEEVKMHDVVRDVAISIASREKHRFLITHGEKSREWPKKATYEPYTSISVISNEIAEFPDGLRCPKLVLLLIECGNSSVKIPSNFFEGMGELKVLVLGIKRNNLLLSSSLQILSNLRTLCLDDCYCQLDNTSVIGELLNLEILSFRNSRIEELPEEIGRLANLRLLDLTDCENLERIPPGVISALVQLQELYMRGCGSINWEGEGNEEGENASLRELESLSNLNTLEIYIKDVVCVPKIPLFSKLTKYKILIGYGSRFSYHEMKRFQKGVSVRLKDTCTILLDCGGINSLLRSTQFLELEGKGTEATVQELFREGVKGLQQLMHLSISECETPEYLANTMDCVPQTPNSTVATPLPVFPILESLVLDSLPNLKQICHGQFPANSFGKLKRLEISDCDKMEEVIIWKERGEEDDATTTKKIEFPNLESMVFWSLPRLVGFFKGIDQIEFPQLKELKLCELPQVKWPFLSSSNPSSDIVENNNAALLQSLFSHKVTFPSLEELKLDGLQNMNEIWCNQLLANSFSKLVKLVVSDCGSLRNVFSPFMARYLVHLRELIIESCSMVEEVISKEEDEEEKGEGRIDRTPFPKLKELGLFHLPVLKRFCHITHDWELPLVDTMTVFNCPQMKIFSPGFMHVPNLDRVNGYRKENFWTGDLNNTMLHLHEKAIQSAFKEFESRIPIMEEIIEALKDDKINLIGVCGMGGVGKTTMVKQVAKIAEEKNLFHEVAMAVVSQEPNLKLVQSRIAEMLGLKLDIENLSVRASLLRQRLLHNKKILVILDDVWEDFDLDHLGFPLGGNGNKGCKILFTSPSQNMWRGIQNKRNIQLEVLSKEEAWHLFREKAGDYVDSPDLLPLAKEIVDECVGLPIALVIMGSALVNKRNQYHWKDALQQVKTPCAETVFSGVLAKVYRVVDFSYSSLKDDGAKKLFLLCCLYIEDYEIPIENLVRYAIGLQWFEGVNKVDEVRDRVHVLVDQLKSCYLLLDGDEEEEVKMHGVVRNVAISIASRDEHVLMPIHGAKSRGWPKKAAFEHYTSISVISDEIAEFPEGLSCPKLEFLLIKCRNSSLKIPNNFFKGMGELKVLKLGITENILLLPLSFQILSNLRTLCLDYCHQFDNISLIGELLNLEILSFRDSRLEELPEEIGRLVNLRLLDLTRCDDLRRIPHGVISALVQLQELYMSGCSIDWEGEGEEEGEDASMREFESLSNLNTLEINLGDAAVLPGNLWNIFSNLKKYSILMEEEGMQWTVEYLCTIPSECRMNSPLNIIEFLKLGGKRSMDVVRKLDREGVELGVKHLKGMSIERCDAPECLFNTMDWVPGTPILYILKDLCLSNLPNLREIFQGQLPVGSLIKLSFISIYGCDKLENLFQLSIARCLTQRKHLQILYCDIMDEVIWKEERGEDAHAHDAKEVIWKETGLPRFIGFWIDEIEFPQLKELHLKNLPKLKCLFANMSSDLEDNHNVAFSSIYHLKVAFPSLEVLELSCLDNLEELGYDPLSVKSFSKLMKVHVRHCGKLLNVIPSQLFAGLQNLEELTMEDCTSLEKVFKLEVVDYEEQDCKMLPSLKSLKLKNLPKLNHIPKSDSIGFMYIPQLSILHVHDLDSLKYLFSPIMIKSIPQLQELDIMRCKLMSRIVVEENGQGESSVDKIEFPQLKILRLCDMPNLVSFFPKVIDAVAASNDSLQSPMQPISKQKIAFPSLEVLELKHLYKLEGLAIGIMHIPRLTILHVHDCHRLRYLFLPATVKSIILQLQELEIMRCKIMTRIIAEESVHGETLVEKIEFPQLTTLLLYDLPNLVSFIPKVVSTVVGLQSPVQHFFNENVAFPRLEKLHISDCGSFRNLFYPFMAKYLVHLQELIISKCSMVEEVVSNEEDEEKGEGMIQRILFPKLKYLELRDLPVLKSFFRVNRIAFPSLEVLELKHLHKLEVLDIGIMYVPQLHILHVHDCDSLKYLFSPVMVKTILQLQELEIMRCKIITRIVAEENGQGDKIEFPQLKILQLYDLPNLVSFFPEEVSTVATSSPAHPLFNQKIAFPNLEVLDLHKLEVLDIGIMYVPQLYILHVHDCDSLKYLFSPVMVKTIPQLQELEIKRCKIMTRIVAEENGNGETLVEKIEFPQLKILLLYYLPNLMGFFPKVVSTVAASNESLQSPVLPLFNENENVTFPSLEKLRVSDCGSFRNLFSPFMAKYLVHLQELIISKCSMVEEVVSNEDGKIDGILFPKLKYLELRDLPVLKSFFHVNDEWEFPLLESITVFDCPETKTLSPGFLCSPNLQIVWVKWWAPDGGVVEGFWTNDLNYTLQQVYSKLQEQLQRREQQQQEQLQRREQQQQQQQQQQEQLQHEQREQLQPRQEQLQLDMTDKKQPIDKMSVWAMTRRATDPDVIQILDEFDRQLSMLPEEGRIIEAKDAIFHDLVGKDGHGYSRTYGKTTPWRAVYGGEAGPSQSIPQAPPIVEITQQVRAELREELKEEMRAEFTAQLEQMRAEMLTLMSQGGNIDPNRRVPDASSSMQLNWSSRT